MEDPSQVTVERFRDASIALMPPGKAFSTDIGGDLAKVLEALSVEPARLHEMASRLLVNYDPAQADEMLPEWEAALGLQQNGSIAERQGALISRLVGRTQHSKSTFERAAIALGYSDANWWPIFHKPICVGSVFATTPEVLQHGHFRIKFTPRLDSSGYANQPFLLSWNLGAGGATSIVLRTYAGSNVQLNVTSAFGAGSTGTRSAVQMTWTAGQQITLEVNSSAGYIAVSGCNVTYGPIYSDYTTFAPIPQSPPWRWPAGVLNIGQIYAGTPTTVFDGTIDAIDRYSLTGIEFKTYTPFVAGECAAGDPLYGDEWANTVGIYVPVSNQTADDALRAAFDYLRRAHGYLNIILEGPMGAERVTTTWFDRAVMSVSTVNTNTGYVAIRYSGYVSIHVVIDDGAGNAPTDAPTGTFEIWSSSDGITFTQYVNGVVTAEMSKIAAVGNALVGNFAIFDGMPGQFLKVRYNRVSGGTGNSRMTVKVTAW
jgi:uncharacterized protein YmfQ (DUF2313 family)